MQLPLVADVALAYHRRGEYARLALELDRRHWFAPVVVLDLRQTDVS